MHLLSSKMGEPQGPTGKGGGEEEKREEKGEVCTGAAKWLRVESRGGGRCAREEVATSW